MGTMKEQLEEHGGHQDCQGQELLGAEDPRIFGDKEPLSFLRYMLVDVYIF